MPTGLMPWDSLDDLKYQEESHAIAALLEQAPLSSQQRKAIVAQATELVTAARATTRRQGVVESFLQEFSLGTQEGLALMCLAEALLRTPDPNTRDRLIAEKIGSADWARHLGQSDSIFVNASTWGLMLTGKLIEVENETKGDVAGWLRRLTQKLGEPVIRHAVAAAVKIMGEQFVLGRTIEAALTRADKEQFLCSFDMLGEGARTFADAERYEGIYAAAIEAVGQASGGSGPELGHGVSVKLSALSPRYEAVHSEKIWDDLYPRVRRLARIAARHDLNLAIDAEEADRLVISLKIIERLAREPEFSSWKGLGVVVQAYQKRGPQVIQALAQLAEVTGQRIMVRLVKGAYWDSEIKRAQVSGRPDYAVYTTKAATDLSYLVCARALIAASPRLYPQFATHNAHTLVAVRTMAQASGVTIEHQRLHGMGEALYDAGKALYGSIRLRAYAPVGGHEDLLPYLVRRLLENGANTSFVHALLDERIPAELVVQDPIALVEAHPHRHPKIALPADLYGPGRKNPLGRDYSIASEQRRAAAAHAAAINQRLSAGPVIAGKLRLAGAPALPVTSPVDRRLVLGDVSEAGESEVELATAIARAAQPRWDSLGGAGRAPILRAMGDALESEMDRFIALLSLEAGKTLNDAVADVREAVDFCRYYARLAEEQFGGPSTLTGPVGETNKLEMRGRGVFLCISPWNFPLAIFTGQIVAALAAGNTVIAKPAEQTVLVAFEAVRLFHKAGLPPEVLALLPGKGSALGPLLTGHSAIDGVAFTGGTETAYRINRSLAARSGPIIPLIAETGGLNSMFVDTTALKEQVVDDVLVSAMGAAGQRCSALRILYLPAETADSIISTLCGALEVQQLGEPWNWETEIGPVIDLEARRRLDAHVERLRHDATILYAKDVGSLGENGTYFGPVIAEVPRPDYLEHEVFGPILHIYRYEPGELHTVAQLLQARGYGLTLGIHSRIERFAQEVSNLVSAGNIYINRSIIGAVVGVQPFGGVGMSGTGPKAGGPHALMRYAVERAISNNITAQGGDPALLNL